MTQIKEADRLTAETARVGMRVRCRHTGHSVTVMRVEGRNVRIAWDADTFLYAPDRFIPVDPQPDQSLRAILSERAPDLLAALVEWHAAYTSPRRSTGTMKVRLPLWAAIERAGLLPEPKQPTPLPAMWCGADAFTQENDNGR